MFRFSVWLVSCYTHVFVLIWVVIVTLPTLTSTRSLISTTLSQDVTGRWLVYWRDDRNKRKAELIILLYLRKYIQTVDILQTSYMKSLVLRCMAVRCRQQGHNRLITRRQTIRDIVNSPKCLTQNLQEIIAPNMISVKMTVESLCCIKDLNNEGMFCFYRLLKGYIGYATSTRHKVNSSPVGYNYCSDQNINYQCYGLGQCNDLLDSPPTIQSQ